MSERPLVYTIPQAAEALAVSRSTVYRLIAEGLLETIKVRSRTTGEEYDFSLPRRESKTGAGHRGFAVAPDPALSDAEAAARRDFTVNAIACDPFTGELIDPHNGQRDL